MSDTVTTYVAGPTLDPMVGAGTSGIGVMTAAFLAAVQHPQQWTD